jgi:general secretion pathway protein A
VVIFVDDAQTLAAEVLEQVRLISNLETSRDKLIQIVLIGEPELMDQLASRALRQMGQRVSVGYSVGRLTEAETAAYLQHRLSRASIGPPLHLESAVVQVIFNNSAGNPRRINLSAAALLSAAFKAGRSTIDKRFAQAVLQDRERDEQPSASQGGTSRHRRSILCVVGLMAVCSAGLFFLRPSQELAPELGMEQSVGDLAATAAAPDAPAPIEAAPDLQAPAVAAVEDLPSPEENSSLPLREREVRLTHSVQVGAFLQPENARQMMARMTSKGYPARMVKITDSKGRTWLTVRIGDYPSRHAAQAHAEDFIRREQMEAVVQPFGE